MARGKRTFRYLTNELNISGIISFPANANNAAIDVLEEKLKGIKGL